MDLGVEASHTNDMTLFIILALLVLFAVASARYGADSRKSGSWWPATDHSGSTSVRPSAR
jgi:hypothetical protein